MIRAYRLIDAWRNSMGAIPSDLPWRTLCLVSPGAGRATISEVESWAGFRTTLAAIIEAGFTANAATTTASVPLSWTTKGTYGANAWAPARIAPTGSRINAAIPATASRRGTRPNHCRGVPGVGDAFVRRVGVAFAGTSERSPVVKRCDAVPRPKRAVRERANRARRVRARSDVPSRSARTSAQSARGSPPRSTIRLA
jgi:hypothetical protein